MTARSLTRAAFFAGLLGVSAVALATPAHAARNPSAEQYVQENGTAALRTLGDRSVSATQRRRTFNTLMARFADMPRIASFVLGRYGARLRSEGLHDEWNSTFQEYAIAVYEDRLERFSGSTIRVTNSIERVPGRDVIVVSELAPRGGGRATVVQWRLLRIGEAWKVVDVSLVLEGNTAIWLAQQQQRDFLALLDRNNGDIRALMTSIRTSTAEMRDRIMARS